jgi:hypothetical protein
VVGNCGWAAYADSAEDEVLVQIFMMWCYEIEIKDFVCNYYTINLIKKG